MVESEFASLCNRLVSADQKAVRSRDQLKEVVEKALGYLSVGLDRLVVTSGEKTSDRMAALIERYPLEWIFPGGLRPRAGTQMARGKMAQRQLVRRARPSTHVLGTSTGWAFWAAF